MASRTALKKTIVMTGILMNVIGLLVLPADIYSAEVSPKAVQSQAPMDTATTTQAADAQTSRRLSDIRAMLNDTATGQEALSTIDEHGVEITFATSAGSFYAYWNNTVVIDLDAEITQAALLIVHEATHVGNDKAGLWLQPEDVSRNTYVNALLQEEAEAEANVVEAKLELEKAGFDVTNTSLLLETQYSKAYAQEIEFELMRNRGKTTEERERNARHAARSRLHAAFLTGEVVRSTDGLTYGEVYGNDWDKITFSKMGVAGDLQTNNYADGSYVA